MRPCAARSVTTGAMNDGTRNPRINPWASDSPDAVRVTAVDDQGHLLPASNHGVWVDIGARGTATSNAAPRGARRPRRSCSPPIPD